MYKQSLLFFSLFFFTFFSNVLFGLDVSPYYVYDMTSLRDFDRSNPQEARRVWDETLLISALQGLANRDSAQFYVLFVYGQVGNIDAYWLDLFSHAIPSEPPRKGWLETRERREITSLDEALDLFSDVYKGVVVYDESIPSTVNVALTIAGADSLLPVRYDSTRDSLYDRLVNNRKLPILARLINADGSPMFTGNGKIPGTELDSTGSIKVDPYYWLIENYIKTGKTNPLEGGYYIDAHWLIHPIGAVQNHCLTNRDFGVSRKGFFFDLSPWEDEVPNDDPNQTPGTDFTAFNAILRAAYDATGGQKIIRIAGFTPWDAKYTNYGAVGGSHSPVDTEWRHAELLSNYNAYLDADAPGLNAMANASFYQHFPLDEVYSQVKPTVKALIARGYVNPDKSVADKTFVSIYAGDYDSSAWVYQSSPQNWQDPARGTIPISWAFNPNLADRFAPGFDYFRRTQTPNDFFTSGDSGAGYVNPTGFVEPRRFSNLPDGLDVWIKHSLRYFKQWDLSGIGFLIDGSSRTVDRQTLTRLTRYAPDGITTHRGQGMGVVPNVYGGKTAFRPMNFDLSDPETGAGIVLGDVRFNKGPQFNVYRTILWKPSQFKDLYDRVKSDEGRGSRVEFVDAYTFWLLLRLESKHTGQSEIDLRL